MQDEAWIRVPGVEEAHVETLDLKELISELELSQGKVSELERSNHDLKSLAEALAAENQWLREQFGLARARQFGSSSEKTEAVTGQEMLFNEAEVVADSSEAPVTEETIQYTRKKKSVGHREEMLKDLPVEVIEHRLPVPEQVCSACGGAMHEMTSETRDELEIIPASAKVVRHVRYIYGCRHCERHEIEVPIVRSPAPAPIIERSIASASSIAYVMASKFLLGYLYTGRRSISRGWG